MSTGTRVRRRLVVRGVVQGVGFRPHVYALASSLHLGGAVWNDAAGVVIEVEGPAHLVDAFVGRLQAEPPPLARLTEVAVEDLAPVGGTGFTIRASEQSAGRTFVSPDVTICDDCLAELRRPGDRRFRHPFVTCTNCGPRYTITTDLPYDRPTTTMAGFPMCATCAREYADPADRRFHAQTVCCPDCGPRAVAWSRPGAADLVRRGGARARRGACSRAARSSRSRASAATTSPATPAATRRWPCCASASSAATSRSRSWSPTSPTRPRLVTSTAEEARLLTGRGAADRAGAAPHRTPPVSRRGRARQRRPRRDARLRPAAPPPARAARRPPGSAGAGDDQRQPRRRADRDRRREARSTGSPASPTPGSPTTGRSTCPATTR